MEVYVYVNRQSLLTIRKECSYDSFYYYYFFYSRKETSKDTSVKIQRK